ncbi:MAG: ABC transporter permease subunit [Lachnospiraceae bacterium]|nr:ABC transporter permease subunit [Lachnospiraceae bacterium]MDD3614705.1 ABC transporter permease subunit [Lachnospiraceae bacterium]
MRKEKNTEIKIIFWIVTIVFAAFLLVPTVMILAKSFSGDSGVGVLHYVDVLTSKRFAGAFRNSILISLTEAVFTTVLAFLLAYTINFTNVNKKAKKFIRAAAVLPMLLPTITYGFAIIYSFGKQGLITRILGTQIFDIYGFNGLLLGYVIYTLPISFMLINNTMGYIDKKFLLVSRVMGDSPLRTFMTAVLRPLWGTLAASVIQCFFLSFTDFGIPASVGGQVDVVAGILYEEMLGSIPNFNNGAVVAVMMLLPSVVSITILHLLERYNVRYSKISVVELKKSKPRDLLLGGISIVTLLAVLSIFAVIVIVPFVSEWPYRMTFTFDNVRAVFEDTSLVRVYGNSLYVALITAVVGSLIVYGAALVTARSTINKKCKKIIESIALVTNTIPGMVLGIAFMLTFTGTAIQNTFFIIILCNVLHFFSTPYLMMKNSLEKMNSSWETTARLMGDNWIKTVIRVVTPNALSTILEVFSYYFVNAMVTVSAIIFIAGARTMVITAKIKELQHFAKFNEIFILSLLILVTNLVAKGIFQFLANRKTNEDKQPIRGGKIKMRRIVKGAFSALMAGVVLVSGGLLSGCGTTTSANGEEVVLYSNADDEAITAMKDALDSKGYAGQYIIQSFGTSELGGKLLAEGTDIEADLVTMSSFYIDSAQTENAMFANLTFDTGAMKEYPAYYTPITAQEGAIIINTEVMKENNLPMPASIKDLANPEYKGFLSVTDIKGSSTAWLLIQALISEYGEDEAKDILTSIYENAGDHLEDSGSGPIKKVRAGEVAVGFGLRHQAVADKAEGLPIDFVDPVEGNFTLTESVAVIDKGENTNPLAMEMAECIIKDGRAELLNTYPVPLYEGETADEANASGNPKEFSEPLTAELLMKHQELSESCK